MQVESGLHLEAVCLVPTGFAAMTTTWRQRSWRLRAGFGGGAPGAGAPDDGG